MVRGDTGPAAGGAPSDDETAGEDADEWVGFIGGAAGRGPGVGLASSMATTKAPPGSPPAGRSLGRGA